MKAMRRGMVERVQTIGTAIVLSVLGATAVLMPMLAESLASNQRHVAAAEAQTAVSGRRAVYEMSFAFRSMQVNAQNVLLLGDSEESRRRFAGAKGAVYRALAALELIDGTLDPTEREALRNALESTVQAYETTLAALGSETPERVTKLLLATHREYGAGEQLSTLLQRQEARVAAASSLALDAEATAHRIWAVCTVVELLLLGGIGLALWRELRRRRRGEREIALLNVALQARVEELSDANAELSAFGYHVAHDLRAPLRHVSIQASRLDDLVAAQGDERQRRSLAGVYSSVERMGRLVDGLLEYARVGRTALAIGMVDTGALVDELIEAERAVHPERAANITRGPLPMVAGDITMLGSVFQNLLDNALKYSADRQPPVVKVSAVHSADGGEHVFEVSDNGAGFDPAHAERLFGMFQRLHGRDEYAGHGVGLALVRRIVERHRGKIWAQGSPGVGANFFFTLPVHDVTREGEAGRTQ